MAYPGDVDAAGIPGQPAAVRWGIATSWTTYTAALHGSQPAALLTEKTFTVRDGFVRGFLDLPVSGGRYAALRLRPFLALRMLSGEIGQVTLGELQRLSPGIAAIIAESRNRLNGAVETIETDGADVPGAATTADVAKDIAVRGDEILAEILVDQVRLMDIGVDVGVTLLATGPAVAIGRDVELEWVRFSFGGYGHVSATELTTIRHGSERIDSFVSGGVGLTMGIALLTLRTAHGLEIQPVALEAHLFALFSEEGLSVLAAQLALMLEFTIPM